MHFLYSFPTCKAKSHYPLHAGLAPAHSLAADPGGSASKGRHIRLQPLDPTATEFVGKLPLSSARAALHRSHPTQQRLWHGELHAME